MDYHQDHFLYGKRRKVNVEQCVVKYNKFYNAYDVLLSLQENFNDIRIFFDTGASRTVITLKEFLQPYEYVKHKDEIIKQLENSSYLRVEPRSASGGKIIGYLCHLNNVQLGDGMIDSFYFFLVPNERSQDSLLGNDFLHYCDYVHDANGDIAIKSFDSGSYEEYFERLTSHNLKYRSLDLRSLFENLKPKVETKADLASLSVFKD